MHPTLIHICLHTTVISNQIAILLSYLQIDSPTLYVARQLTLRVCERLKIRVVTCVHRTKMTGKPGKEPRLRKIYTWIDSRTLDQRSVLIGVSNGRNNRINADGTGWNTETRGRYARTCATGATSSFWNASRPPPL